MDGVPNANGPGFHDARPHAERERLRGHLIAAVLADRGEGIEIRHAGVGIECRHRATPDIPAGLDDGCADMDATPDPRVFGVRVDARDAEEHPEAARVDTRADP